MLEDLDHLQTRIDQVVALALQLRGDNQSLRAQLAETQVEARRLQSRLDAARARIDALIEKLPVNS